MPSRYWPDVKQVLENLFSLQKEQWATWEEKESKKPHDERSLALQTKAVISRWRWIEITQPKLEQLLSSEQPIRFADEMLILFLPPFPKEEREFVPVVSIEYNPTNDCLNLRVGMYCLDEYGIPCGFGFRLESPTSLCSDGHYESIHDFHHIQLIKAVDKCAPPLNMPTWLPEYQPAICIRADNPVDGFLNLVLSLYGLDYYKDFLKPIKSRIQVSANQMRKFA